MISVNEGIAYGIVVYLTSSEVCHEQPGKLIVSE